MRRHVRGSFYASVFAGIAAGGALLLSRDTLFSALGDGEALRAGRGYYVWRCMSIPFKTSSNASIGVLGGYGYVHVVSVMNSVVAVLQVSMVGVVLRACWGSETTRFLDRLRFGVFRSHCIPRDGWMGDCSFQSAEKDWVGTQGKEKRDDGVRIRREK